jgi:hypothetical protein
LPDDGGWKTLFIRRLKTAEQERGSLDKSSFLPLSPDVDFRFLMKGSGQMTKNKTGRITY